MRHSSFLQRNVIATSPCASNLIITCYKGFHKTLKNRNNLPKEQQNQNNLRHIFFYLSVLYCKFNFQNIYQNKYMVLLLISTAQSFPPWKKKLFFLFFFLLFLLKKELHFIKHMLIFCELLSLHRGSGFDSVLQEETGIGGGSQVPP